MKFHELNSFLFISQRIKNVGFLVFVDVILYGWLYYYEVSKMPVDFHTRDILSVKRFVFSVLSMKYQIYD